MSIIETVTESTFRAAFERYDRTSNFTHAALGALYEHLEAQSEASEEPIKLDVIGLCCEWTESYYDDALSEVADELSEHDEVTAEHIRDVLLERFSTVIIVEHAEGPETFLHTIA